MATSSACQSRCLHCALGIAASTSSIILGGGTKGKRLAMPNTRIMIHPPLGGASGQAVDVGVQS